MKLRIALIALAVLATTSLAHAQNGCVDSPECPTAVLAAVGGLGIALVKRFKRS
jgi:XrtJ-associated TM-motif-TM protein